MSLNSGGGKWDQFAVNQQKFNVKSSWDESKYTSKIEGDRKSQVCYLGVKAINTVSLMIPVDGRASERKRRLHFVWRVKSIRNLAHGTSI